MILLSDQVPDVSGVTNIWGVVALLAAGVPSAVVAYLARRASKAAVAESTTAREQAEATPAAAVRMAETVDRLQETTSDMGRQLVEQNGAMTRVLLTFTEQVERLTERITWLQATEARQDEQLREHGRLLEEHTQQIAGLSDRP